MHVVCMSHRRRAQCAVRESSQRAQPAQHDGGHKCMMTQLFREVHLPWLVLRSQSCFVLGPQLEGLVLNGFSYVDGCVVMHGRDGTGSRQV